MNKHIKNVNYTYKLNINEPSLYATPIFRILDDSGEIMNACSSVIVSKIRTLIYLYLLVNTIDT